jgi:large subunit ribosomal protein L3
MKALITKKIGMTTILGDNGEAVGVTLLSASPNVITQIKDIEKDGYLALQIGTGEDKRAGKTKQGHFKAAGVNSKIVREIRINQLDEEQKVGDQLSADIFEVGDSIDATGITKGKGFAGTIKRHNFKRGRKTHGGRSYRRPGSIGSMYPQHIFKGKKMAGQMGHDQRTVKRLRVALVDTDLKIIAVRGAVPGPNKGTVLIKEAK